MIDFLPDIVSQHAEEASFLWILRRHSTSAANCSLADIEAQEERIEAHLDGLRLAPEFAWNLFQEQLPDGDPGDIFAATILAIESGHSERVEAVKSIAQRSEAARHAFVGAMDWVADDLGVAQIRRMKTDTSNVSRCIAIEACALRRLDPGTLVQALSNEDPELRGSALRCAGMVGLVDLTSVIREQLASDEPNCRFWAAWSGTLLGDAASRDALNRFTREPGPYRTLALELVLRSIDHASSVALQRRYRDAEPRLAIALSRITGDPDDVPWLLEQMGKPELARQAGETFSWITGTDLERQGLSLPRPGDFEDAADDPANPEVQLNPDDKLPWPCPDRIRGWWQTHSAEFAAGQRYFIGKPPSEERLWDVLQFSTQSRRAAAALDIVIRHAGQPMFMVGAVGWRQRRWLTEKGRYRVAAAIE